MEGTQEILKEIRSDIKGILENVSGLRSTIEAHRDRIVKLESADATHEKDINECHAKHREHEGVQKALVGVGGVIGCILVVAQLVLIFRGS